jgi:hypothetical protein
VKTPSLEFLQECLKAKLPTFALGSPVRFRGVDGEIHTGVIRTKAEYAHAHNPWNHPKYDKITHVTIFVDVPTSDEGQAWAREQAKLWTEHQTEGAD